MNDDINEIKFYQEIISMRLDIYDIKMLIYDIISKLLKLYYVKSIVFNFEIKIFLLQLFISLKYSLNK